MDLDFLQSRSLRSSTSNLHLANDPSLNLVLLIGWSTRPNCGIPGVILGASLISLVDENFARVLLGIFISSIGIYTIYKNRNNKNLKIYNNDAQINQVEFIKTLAMPITLIFLVLGSIFAGIATPTEASAIGAFGALIIAYINGKINFDFLKQTSEKTAIVSTMIFTILIGASIFSLIFRGVGGDDLIDLIFNSLPGGAYAALIFVLVIIFFLGFILDFIEICYVIVPLVAPPLLMMGFEPVWLAILFAINLQTSFLTPPFGFSLFYLRGVADESIQTNEIYRGAVSYTHLTLPTKRIV